MNSTNKRLVTAKELAEILRVPILWIYGKTWRGINEIPHIKFGKYLRFDPEAVIDHFARREKGSECRAQ